MVESVTLAKEDHRRALPVISLIVLLAAGTIWSAYSYYQAQSRAVENNIGNQLTAVADLKVGQFEAWRRERIAAARLIAGNPLLRRAGGSEAGLGTWLNGLGFSAILVVDRNGRVRFSAGDQSNKPESEWLALAAATQRSGQVTVADLHWTSHGEISMEVAAPIPGESGAEPNGVVMTRIDPYRYLYPMIRKWPIPSQTRSE